MMHAARVEKATVLYPRVTFRFSLLIVLYCCRRKKKKIGKFKKQLHYFFKDYRIAQLSYAKKYFKARKTISAEFSQQLTFSFTYCPN